MDSSIHTRSDDEWSRVEALLDRAFDHPEEGRERWVRAVEKDVRIADEVIALLRASDRAGLLDRPLPPPSLPGDDAAVAIRERLAQALAGRYRLDEILGRGGMAIVFRAHETKHDRAVVLKVLRPEVARWVGAERFLAEIQIVARLSHPHIVSLIDSGDADGLLYYVMPFLGGETLRDRLARGPLAAADARAVLRDMAEALAHAHANGLVHRDLKPDNILLVEDHAYLMDFGVAKLARDASPLTATLEGVAIGTPAYMAPEQAIGGSVDARADVYAWGLVAREVFLGRLDPRAPLDDLVPPTLARLVNSAHANNPDERPADGAALVAGLEGTAQPVPKQRRRRPIVVAALGLAVAATLAAIAWLQRGEGNRLESISAPVVVAPFRNETGDSALGIWGRLAGDLITQGLQETGRVGVVPWPVALEAAQDSAVRAGGALASALANETEAGTVVTGTYYLIGDRVRLEAGFVDARSGTTVAVVPAVDVPRDSIESGVRELRNRAMGFVAIRTDQRTEGERGAVESPPTYESYRLYERGIEAYNRQEYQQAAVDLEQSWRRDTLFLRPLVYAARAMWNVGERSRADSMVRELRRRPTGLNVYHELLVRYLESLLAGDGVKALTAIREAAALAPGGRASYNVAMTALSVGRSELALQTLREINPDRGAVKGWAPYWYALSHAHHLQGNYAEELAVAQELRRRHPDARAGWVHLVRANAALGNIAGVDSAIAEASALPPDTYWSQAAMMVTAAEELDAHFRGRGAAAYYRRAAEWLGNQLARNPSHRAHRFWMGSSLYNQGEYADAEPYFESLTTDFPDDLQFRATLALIAARAGHHARAGVLLGEAPQYERGEYLSYQARMAAIQGDRERAIALWSEALGSGRSGIVWVHSAARRDIVPIMDDERFRRLGVVP